MGPGERCSCVGAVASTDSGGSDFASATIGVFSWSVGSPDDGDNLAAVDGGGPRRGDLVAVAGGEVGVGGEAGGGWSLTGLWGMYLMFGSPSTKLDPIPFV